MAADDRRVTGRRRLPEVVAENGNGVAARHASFVLHEPSSGRHRHAERGKEVLADHEPELYLRRGCRRLREAEQVEMVRGEAVKRARQVAEIAVVQIGRARAWPLKAARDADGDDVARRPDGK